jgi:hypothetical protein
LAELTASERHEHETQGGKTGEEHRTCPEGKVCYQQRAADHGVEGVHNGGRGAKPVPAQKVNDAGGEKGEGEKQARTDLRRGNYSCDAVLIAAALENGNREVERVSRSTFEPGVVVMFGDSLCTKERSGVRQRVSGHV